MYAIPDYCIEDHGSIKRLQKALKKTLKIPDSVIALNP